MKNKHTLAGKKWALSNKKNMNSTNYTFIGKGLYSLTEVRRLTGIPVRRIVRWTRGYNYNVGEEKRHSDPIIAHELDSIGGKPVLTFRDLVEIRFLDAFLSHGVSWKTIRICAERAKEVIEHSHPFSTRLFKTDGKTILADFKDEIGENKLLDLKRMQYAFRNIVSGGLYTGIMFNAADEATQWWPMGHKAGIVIDPSRNFGAPIISGAGIPTKVLMDSVKANESIDMVAYWFNIKPTLVESAVKYEKSLAA